MTAQIPANLIMPADDIGSSAACGRIWLMQAIVLHSVTLRSVA